MVKAAMRGLVLERLPSDCHFELTVNLSYRPVVQEGKYVHVLST